MVVVVTVDAGLLGRPGSHPRWGGPVAVVIEERAQPPERSVQVRLDRADWHVEHLRDLSQGQVLVEAKDDAATLVVGERGEPGPQIVELRVGVRRGSMRWCRSQGPESAVSGVGAVDDARAEIGRRLVEVAEPGGAGGHPGEGVHHDLLGLVLRSGQQRRQPDHGVEAVTEPHESELEPLREQLLELDPAAASLVGNRDLFGQLATAAMLDPLREAVARWEPDLIVRDPCEYASAVVAAETSLPVAQAAISLAAVEWGSIAAAAPALEGWRVGLSAIVRSTPYVTRFPASLDPSPFPTTIRFREPWVPAEPLPDWWPGDDRPLVYATFGTVLGHMSTAVRSMAVLLDAVAGLDARVLLTTGRGVDPVALGPAPANVRVEQWVDQADALEAASVVVCHGGSGTTFGALARGVPVVVVPMFADQPVNAVAVERAGAGTVVWPADRRSLGDGDAERIERAVRVIVDRSRSRPDLGGPRHAAAAIGAEMAALRLLLDVFPGDRDAVSP